LREQAIEDLGVLAAEDLGEARSSAAKLGKSYSSHGYDWQQGIVTKYVQDFAGVSQQFYKLCKDSQELYKHKTSQQYSQFCKTNHNLRHFRRRL
jgi:hypothetical protein